MTDVNDARSALAAIPGWAGQEFGITLLAGGLTNRSFLVERGADRYVLRLADMPPESGIRDHRLELEIHRAAAQRDLAADVIFADPAVGLLLTRYLPGRVWSGADLHELRNLERLADVLQRLHELPACGTGFDAAGAADYYLAVLAEHDAAIDEAGRCRAIIDETAGGQANHCCHNDLVAGNIVGGSDLRLLDFEYARDNEPLFDLASLIGWHDLGERHGRYLLDAYTGGADAKARELLQLQRRRFDAIQWLWLAARQCLRPEHGLTERLRRVGERLN